ncbi:MAG: thiamine biosynthesis protein ThiS [Verrucomicrobia bacterium TMED44]|nr:MAG: thiamine biosynthesis protein ThiS [Verrucomicrobia bacterium TMED44]|tara:strand:+ start:52 stop:255 length:204 start_codon:yes stop_codon:yes gene_type:complete
MKISVNDENYEILDDSNLTSLLNLLGMKDLKGWALALNEKVIAKSDFDQTKLIEGDRVILIQATQGG